jgi:hypothetical protein
MTVVPLGRSRSTRRRDRVVLAVVTGMVLLGVWVLAGLAELAGDGVAMRRLGGAGGAALGVAELHPVPPGVRIEELVTSSASTFVDEDGEHPDWLELHNPTGTAQPLDGLVLQVSSNDAVWALPDRELGPGEHLVVFASGKDRADGELHTSFRLPQGGVDLVLGHADGRRVVDRMSVPELARDTSFGRDPQEPGRWCHFAYPSPGETNAPECHDEDLGVPTFSAASGFYDDPVELSIEPAVGDAELLYTLDGSYPDLDANPASTLRYDGPLTIADRSSEPDRLTGITTSSWIDHQAPLAPVDKATVVRARTPFGRERVEVFFIGEQHRRELPVLHLAADHDHLFDPDGGIYVPGRVYEEYVRSDGFDPEHRWDVPANFMERGRAWERPAEDDLRRRIVLHHCDAPDGCDFAAPVGLRTHGNISRSFPVKTLRVYARRDYGPAELEHPFFGGGDEERHRRLLLRTSGNDWRGTLLSDGFFQSLVAHLGPETQAYQPAVLYLNGEYWGVHNLRERYDEHYLELTHGVDADDVVVLGRRLEVERGEPSDVDELLELFELLAAELADLQERPVREGGRLAPEVRQRLERQVDVDNLIDYLALELFSGNNDWPGNNVRMWRTRSEVEGITVADGRWRWMIFDLDQAGGSVQGFASTISLLGRLLDEQEEPAARHGLPTLFQALLADEAYRHRVLTRFADHLNTTFAPHRTIPELDRLGRQLEPEIERHAARWPAFGTAGDWEERMARLRGFLRLRAGQQFVDLDRHLVLGGTYTLGVEPTRGGRVQVGSIHLGDQTPGVRPGETFTGRYFRDVPVTVTATPEPGYRFLRWDGGPDPATTTSSLVLRGGGDVTLRAVFERTAGNDEAGGTRP